MKKTIIAMSLIFMACTLIAQHKDKCPAHTLFSKMQDAYVSYCEDHEFNTFPFYTTNKDGERMKVEKSGVYSQVSYMFNDFDKRPSVPQILQNHGNAIKQIGGEILYQSGGSLYGKLKKSDGVYWIEVLSDGSGMYSITSVMEAAMRQDVVATADVIKKGLVDEGKMSFYGIYFDTNKAVVKPESAPTLAEMAKFLKGNPSMKVYIVGHTDNVGELQYNIKLSKDRATAVVNELTTKYAISTNQLIANGVGPLSPVTNNTSESSRAKNRRVEMVVR